MSSTDQSARVTQYFVDEAGDLSLFDKRGRVIVGTEGVSNTFMLGFAVLADPVWAAQRLEMLRADLVADPYFAGVPSMRLSGRKTARCFHAKDDLPEVRREVFRLMNTLGGKVRVVMRRKSALAVEGKALFVNGRRLSDDDIYDDLVRQLAKSLPDDPGLSVIVFARRGKSARTTALANAIMQQEHRTWPHQVTVRFESATEYETFLRKNGLAKAAQMMANNIASDSQGLQSKFAPAVITSAYPHQSAGLQVVDYYLWALQRLIERREDRFYNLVASNFEAVFDLDDKRHDVQGARYDPTNPLTLEKIPPVMG